MADSRVRLAVKITDPATDANEAGVDATGNLKVILAANTGVDIGDVDVLSLPTSPDTIADDAAFTAASKVFPAGLVFDDTAPDPVDEGDVGYQRMSVRREGYAQIRDAAGGERGVNVDAVNNLNVILAANSGVDIGDIDILSGPTGASALQTQGTAADGAAPVGNPVLIAGHDGTNVQFLKTDANGELQVDVLTGGGSDVPAGEARAHSSSTDTAAGASFSADSADFGAATKKLAGVDVSASVPVKVEIMSVSNDTETILDVLFGRAGEPIIWRPPHRDYYETVFTANAGFDGFRAKITNLDNAKAANLYGTIYSED